MTNFFRIAILAIFCLSLTGKMLLKDACADEISPKTKTAVVYNLSDSSDSAAAQDCGCHCHHGHLDFSFINNPSTIETKEVQVFAFDFSSSLPLHVNSPARPPKIVS